MYAAIWHLLPGHTWAKVVQAACIIGIVVLLLFEVVFPWAAGTFVVFDNTVG